MPQASPSASAHPGPDRVVAIGDLHGNYPGLLRILSETGLVDAAGRWQARNTRLVQMGDVLGRGGEPGKIFSLLRRLEAEAPAFGSRVHMLLGNHEAMSIKGVLRYNTLEEFRDLAESFAEEAAACDPRSAGPDPGRGSRLAAGGSRCDSAAPTGSANTAPAGGTDAGRAGSASGGSAAAPAATAAEKYGRRLDMMGARGFHALLSPRGTIGSWLLAHDSAVAIDGHLFVHGGLDRAHGLMPLAVLNARVREDLAREDGDAAPGMLRREGPQWNREYLLKPGGAKRAELKEVLAYHGCRRMVVGHTPTSCVDPEQAGRIVPLYGDRMLCIDTGIGLAYGGRLSALIVEGGKAFPRYFG